MGTEVIAGIYAPQGKLLSAPTDELKPVISGYLQNLEQAGREIATGMKLAESTGKFLEQFSFPII